MKRKFLEFRRSGFRCASVGLMGATALVLALALTMPAGAAETRAVKSRVAPVYPEIARRMKIAGEVKLSVTVNPEGKVTDVKTLSGNRMLSAAAEDAVRKWKFESGANSTTVEVGLNFALGQ